MRRPPPGEQLVAAYLRERGLKGTRHGKVGDRRLDFVVDHTGGPFAMEVYDGGLKGSAQQLGESTTVS